VFPEDAALASFKQTALEQCVAWFGPPAHPDWPLRLRPSPFAGAAAVRHEGQYVIYINPVYQDHEHRFPVLAHEMYHYFTLDRRHALRRLVWVDEMLAEMTALRLLREQGMNDLADRHLEWLQAEKNWPLPLFRLKRVRRNRLRMLAGGSPYPEGFSRAVSSLGLALQEHITWEHLCQLATCRTWPEWLTGLPPRSREAACRLLDFPPPAATT
jgi:hypothetical protein